MHDRILIVDDEPLVLEVLSDVLTREGFLVSQAAEAPKALEQLDHEPHALALCDIRMPGTDGFALAQTIHQHPQLARPVVILLTSGDRPCDARRVEQVGAALYLVKPVTHSELLDAVLSATGLAGAEDRASVRARIAPQRSLPTLRVLLAEDSLEPI